MTEPKRFRSAAVFFVNSRGQILLRQRDDRPGLLEPGRWDVIGGLIEDDETPEAALVREVREEIGLALEGFQFWQEHAGRITDFHLFHAPLEVPVGELRLTEGQQIRFVAAGDALRLPLVPWLREVLPSFLESEAYRSYA